MMTQEQIDIIAADIVITDVINYINEHQEQYKEFLKNEKNEPEESTEYLNKVFSDGKFEVAI